MPGSNKVEVAMALADEFQWKHISMKEVLLREEAKKSEDGKRIADCLKQCKMGKSVSNNHNGCS
jgi:adenylate kinase family enzyme